MRLEEGNRPRLKQVFVTRGESIKKSQHKSQKVPKIIHDLPLQARVAGSTVFPYCAIGSLSLEKSQPSDPPKGIPKLLIFS
jgi:hypothetical protein